MINMWRRLFLLFIIQLSTKFLLIECKIEQVHLSLGAETPRDIVVTWITFDPIDGVPSIEYKVASDEIELNHVVTATGYTQVFMDGSTGEKYEKKVRFVHRVTLNDLLPGVEYSYNIKGDDVWYTFRAIRDTLPHKHLIFGDLGYEGDKLTVALEGELKEDDVSTMIQLGDLAYDLNSNDGIIGDLFMNMMQPLTSRTPFQVVPGNHEAAGNFSHYDARFTMIDQTTGVKNNHFYSFNVGLVHFVAFSTEYYRYIEYGTQQIENQLNWLKEDLTFASSPANRTLRPWIVVLAHTPFYTRDLWVTVDSMRLRGHPLNPEKLFYDASVDVILAGHLHVYQRSWPIFNGRVYKRSFDKKTSVYKNPEAPIHIITGTGGSHFGASPTRVYTYRSNFVAFIDYNFSYTVMTVHNSSSLHFEQRAANQCNATIDQFFIIKT